MKSVTSVSGGKTSSMMALEFPTDHYIFAVVLTDHKPSAPKDKGLLRECQNRIPWFVASHEADLTLLNMLQLEQELGKRIDWVASQYSLDRYLWQDTDLVGYRSHGKFMLPNAQHRFCTEETKLKPMFWHCYLNYFDGKTPLLMNIGFRWDEPRRVEGWTCDKEKFKFPASAWTGLSEDKNSCSLFFRKRQQHKEIEWRISRFPMHEHCIDRLDVAKYWLNKGWQFPEISNCRFCFHHRDIEQQRQAQLEPDNLQWWLEQEEKSGHTFGKRPLKQILEQPLLDVFEDLPCNCTD
jgi:hypothetical protein